MVGLETEAFLEKVRENTGLQNVGLLVLEGENGSVKRDAWTSSFRDVIYALDYPGQVGEPPVITPPDVIPGRFVDIPDPNLRTIIAEELGKSPDAPITVEEMRGLRTLDSRRRRVQDLTGLQFATNLTHLELDNSQISDLSPLRGLTNLTYLEVYGSFSDVSPIAGLINLEHLEIWSASLTDLSPLSGLINLKVVRVPDGAALPPAVIQGGFVHIPDPNLRTVIEEALETKAIRPSAMETLTTLKASDRSILNLAGLEFAVNLEELWISDNPVFDLSPLAGCTNLISLVAWGDTQISDLSPLANLTKLEQLEHKGRMSDISPLANLTNMKILRFYGDGISDISAIVGMTNLTHLQFRHHEVKDISPLAKLFELETLDLHDNNVTDFSPLRKLTKLNFLDLTANRISDISFLSMLTNLTDLQLDINKISDVSVLAGLINLEGLKLEFNEISDVSALEGLTNLELLRLHYNKICNGQIDVRHS